MLLLLQLLSFVFPHFSFSLAWPFWRLQPVEQQGRQHGKTLVAAAGECARRRRPKRGTTQLTAMATCVQGFWRPNYGTMAAAREGLRRRGAPAAPATTTWSTAAADDDDGELLRDEARAAAPEDTDPNSKADRRMLAVVQVVAKQEQEQEEDGKLQKRKETVRGEQAVSLSLILSFSVS